MRSKQKKCAVHVSLWPNTVLNNTSLHIAKSTGFRVVLCLCCTHTHAALILYTTTTLPLHFHYSTLYSARQYTTVHDSTLQCTRPNETERGDLPSPLPRQHCRSLDPCKKEGGTKSWWASRARKENGGREYRKLQASFGMPHSVSQSVRSAMT